MEHIGPLIQTILWVGLIAWIVWRFHSPIYGLLEALRKRVEAGSKIKAGPFELSDLVPQDPVSQLRKIVEETQETLEVEAQDNSDTSKKETSALSTARYFQAEDLALRALQAEYGIPIKRQVTGGHDHGFDGIFELGGVKHIVEVKYIAGTGNKHRFRDAIQRLTSAAHEYGWSNSKIILVLVFERAERSENAKAMLEPAFANNPVPVSVRTFLMPELANRFGVGI